MGLDEFYIMTIQHKKKGNMDVYENVLVKLFGKKLSWSEVKELPKEEQCKLMIELKEGIAINNSTIDIKKLARAIQHSRSGAGGCAITPYECKFCGSEDSWGNTATPGICKKCANKMAANIVTYGMDIFK